MTEVAYGLVQKIKMLRRRSGDTPLRNFLLMALLMSSVQCQLRLWVGSTMSFTELNINSSSDSVTS